MSPDWLSPINKDQVSVKSWIPCEVGAEQVQNLQKPPVSQVHTGLEWRDIGAAQPGSKRPWLEAWRAGYTAK